MSFEQHERSILDRVTPVHSTQLTAVRGSPAGATDDGKSTKAGKDVRAVGVRFLLPAENVHHPETVDLMPGIQFS